jgi:hypothetical protein
MPETPPTPASTGPADEPDCEPADGPDSEPDWQRRKRLAEVFGDVLPDTTSDERDPDQSSGAAGDAADAAGDRWLRSQVPPHHG